MLKILVLECLIICCLYTDIKEKRIPNIFTFSGVVIGFVINFIDGNLLSSIKGTAFSLLIFLLMYKIGYIAAGDVKFMAAVGAITGLEFTHIAVPIVIMAGTLVSLILLAYKRTLKQVLYGSLYDLKYRILIFFGTRKICLEKADLGTVTQIPYMPAIAAGINIAVIVHYIYLI